MSSSNTEWISKIAINLSKFLLGFMIFLLFKRGRIPRGGDGNGCLSPWRANGDTLGLHLGFYIASLLSSPLSRCSNSSRYSKRETCGRVASRVWKEKRTSYEDGTSSWNLLFDLVSGPL